MALEIISWMLCSIFAALSALHLTWIRMPTGSASSAIPTNTAGVPLFRPTPLATFAVACLLAIASALAFLGQKELPAKFNSFVTLGNGTVSLVFFARSVGDFKYFGFFRKIKNTKFAEMDSLLFTPLCLFLSLNGAFLVWFKFGG